MITTSRLQGLNSSAVQHILAAAQALDTGRPDEAANKLAPVLASDSTHPEVLRLRAGILNLQGDHLQAIGLMQQAIALRPDDPLYCNTFATLLGSAGHFDSAIAILHHACELLPEMALSWYNLGILLIRVVRFDEATVALKRAVALAPDYLLARVQLADMLKVSGLAGEAATEYRKVIAQQPWTGTAWWGLADIKTLRFDADDIEQMNVAMREPRASDDDLIATGFALAKALADANRYAESLDSLARANAIARKRYTWDSPDFSAKLARINAAFASTDVAASEELGSNVIFIVGIPRSGSTLLEQVLATHPEVEGAGELLDLPQVLTEESRRLGIPFPDWVTQTRPEDWQRLGDRYLERTARWRLRRPFFTDKLPGNWVYIGAMRAMLPGAKIICCRRDPLETCLSCYRQFFDGNAYARTFEDLALYWREFDRSVRNWHARNTLHIYEHFYESLIADPEHSIRAVLQFCGLPFDPSCLRFHETKRDVRSPSAMQVRQPLRKDTARANLYGPLLDPLRRALGMPPFQTP